MGRQDRRGSGTVGQVLVVDDEADIRELLDMTLARMGLQAHCAGSLADAKRFLCDNQYQLCLTDMRLPDGQGLELVRHIAENCRDLPVAVITAYGSMENAVMALKAGAFDYLSKPVSLEQLRALIKSILELPSQDRTAMQSGERTLLGESVAILHVRGMIEKLARSQAPVYISGESGSGKETAARLIHEHSSRRNYPFVAVNCGAIPETLMESEFFGYKKGAFTGAESDRDGFFQAAQGGTLLLDEVADLPLAMQVKLLRAIQERRVRKVGATNEDVVDVRIVSATHQNLRQLVESGRFRQDLFYRLNVIELKMPALRECREDIPQLANFVLAKLAAANAQPIPRLSPAAMGALCDYPFPGNVRELENVLERALALCSGPEIATDDLQLVPPACASEEVTNAQDGSLQEYLDRVEKQAILDALNKTRFNRTAAAKLLGVTFRSLRYRMERLGMKD